MIPANDYIHILKASIFFLSAFVNIQVSAIPAATITFYKQQVKNSPKQSLEQDYKLTTVGQKQHVQRNIRNCSLNKRMTYNMAVVITHNMMMKSKNWLTAYPLKAPEPQYTRDVTTSKKPNMPNIWQINTTVLLWQSCKINIENRLHFNYYDKLRNISLTNGWGTMAHV